MSFIARGNTITDDELRAIVPSVFAEAAHESRSERYAYIPTSQILEGLRGEGFEPVAARQTKSRDVGQREFTKHMIRFRFAAGREERQIGDVFPEVVLVNSHNGTSAYHLTAGLFRLVCLNGMVVSDGFADGQDPAQGGCGGAGH